MQDSILPILSLRKHLPLKIMNALLRPLWLFGMLVNYIEIMVNISRECGRTPHIYLFMDLAILFDSEYDGYRINIGSIRK